MVWRIPCRRKFPVIHQRVLNVELFRVRFLSNQNCQLKGGSVKYSTYTSRARILIIQESLDGQPGHLEGIPFIFRQIPQLQCKLRDNILYESKFLCQT